MKQFVIFIMIVFVSYVFVACDPIMYSPRVCFISDDTCNIRVTHYDGEYPFEKIIQEFEVDNSYCYLPNQSCLIFSQKEHIDLNDDVFRFDVEISNQKYPLFVISDDLVIKINGKGYMDYMNEVTPSELYDSIASQYSQYIGSKIIKIDNDKLYDCRQLAYKYSSIIDVNLQIDLKGRVD